MKENHRCWAEIDRSALRGNVAFLRQKFGPGVEFLAVVKANAYGHGMIDVARTIADLAGEERVTVMRLAEALQYRAYESSKGSRSNR